MKRKVLVRIHVVATVFAMLIVSIFFISSLIAELNGDPALIKIVKRSILYAIPILLLIMPTLAISGNKLAGTSSSTHVLRKKQRMKFIMMNGVILISLAVFLFYQSHFKSINVLFLIFQIIELAFGFINLVLMGLNIRQGMILSGKLG